MIRIQFLLLATLLWKVHCNVTTTTKKSPLSHRQRQSSDRQVPFIIHEPHFTLCLVSPSISSFSLPLSLLAFLHSFDEVAYFKSLGTSTTLLPWQRCCITYFVAWTMDMWWELFSKISQIIGPFGQMGRINCGVFKIIPVELSAHILSLYSRYSNNQQLFL